MNTIETRFLSAELAKIEAPDGAKIGGYAVPWGVVDSYGTRFRKGAFGGPQTLPLCWNHNAGGVMAGLDAGNAVPVGVVHLSDDDFGRRFEGELFVEDLPEARALARLLKAGALSDCSHTFIRTDGSTGDEITAARMLEVSPVLLGANPAAYVEARSAGDGLTRVLVRAGKVLSKANREALAKAIESLLAIAAAADGEDEDAEVKGADGAEVKGADGAEVRAGLYEAADFLYSLAASKSSLDRAAQGLQYGSEASQALLDALRAELDEYKQHVAALSVPGSDGGQ